MSDRAMRRAGIVRLANGLIPVVSDMGGTSLSPPPAISVVGHQCKMLSPEDIVRIARAGMLDVRTVLRVLRRDLRTRPGSRRRVERAARELGLSIDATEPVSVAGDGR